MVQSISVSSSLSRSDRQATSSSMSMSQSISAVSRSISSDDMRSVEMQESTDLGRLQERVSNSLDSQAFPPTQSGRLWFDESALQKIDDWVAASPCEEWSDRVVAASILRGSEDGCVRLSRLQISCLPAGLSVQSLSLEYCPWVRSLPNDISIAKDLNISGCVHFSSLDHLVLEGDLTLSALPLFHDWLREASIGGQLLVINCPALVTVPYVMTISGDARFSHCTALRGVSERLRIGGDLGLIDCQEIANLPFARMQLGGNLHLEDLPLLRELPRWLNQFNVGREGRRFIFHNIGVPIVAQRHLQQQLLHINFELDQLVTTHSLEPDFKAQIQSWLDVSEVGHDGEADELVRALPRSVDLMEFLQRLADTREYELQPAELGRRIAVVLHKIADSEIPREEAMAVIHHMLSSCNDGLMVCLRDLEMLALVEQANSCPMPKVMLRGLGEDLVKIEAIRDYAFELAEEQRARNQDPDEVEILLYLETALATRLALPLQNRHMLFETRSGIGAVQVNEGEQRANAAANDEQRVEQFLSNWRPWQVQLRKEALADFSKAGQAMRLITPEEQSSLCPLTLESGSELTEPVSITGHSGIFEAKDLLKWWEGNGCHPVTHATFTLDDLQFLRKIRY